MIPYLDDWLIHHPDRQVLLRHQALLLDTLDLVGFILNRKKSELDLTQDIQFLGIHLRLDLGKALLPESKAWEIVARARHLSSLEVLDYTQVSQLLGSLNWASGLIPLGRLYLRPLQRHFHSLGLTDRFTPPRLGPCQLGPCQPTSAMAGPTFSYLRNPDPRISGGLYDFHGRLQSGLGRPHGGFQDFGYLDPYRPQAPHQLCGVQGGYLCPTALGSSASGPPGHDRHGQFDGSFIYQQAGGTRSPTLLLLTVDLFLWLESQSIVVRARHIPGCLNVIADHLSRLNQPIPTEWSLHPKILSRIFRVWGTPEVDMFATLSNSHLPRFMSPVPEPRALAVGALSQDWQGRSMYMFPPFPLLNKVIQKLRSTQVAEVILVAPWWPSQSWFPHLLRLSVEHPLVLPYRRDLLSQQDQKYRKVVPSPLWRLSCDTTKQQAFQTRSLGSRQLLGGPQPIACTMIDGVASLDGLQDRILIHLTPQPLR